MNLKAGLLISEKTDRSYEFWTCAIGLISTSLMSLYMVVLMTTKFVRLPHTPTPILAKLFVPFTLSSGLRLLFDLDNDRDTHRIFSYQYLVLMFLYLCLEIVSHFTRRWRLTKPIHWWSYKFLQLNFLRSKGSYKKCVRVFDTLGSILALIGLILGICSLILDQYDLEFELEGQLKTLKDQMNTIHTNLNNELENLDEILEQLDLDLECENVVAALGVSLGVSAGLGLVPGMKPSDIFVQNNQ